MTTDDTRPRLTCSEFHYPAAVLAERARHAALAAAATHGAAVLNSCGDIYFHEGCKEAATALRAALASEEAGTPKDRQASPNVGSCPACTEQPHIGCEFAK